MGNNEIDDTISIGNDLALLAQCNHTILSYGTYSYYAGVFSGNLARYMFKVQHDDDDDIFLLLLGGVRIVPEHFSQYRNEASWVKPVTLDPFDHPLPRIWFFSTMEKIPKEKRKLSSTQKAMLRRKQEL